MDSRASPFTALKMTELKEAASPFTALEVTELKEAASPFTALKMTELKEAASPFTALEVTRSDFGVWLGAAVVVAEQVPGFFVGGPAGGGALGVEQDCGLFGGDDSVGGDDVPDVFGDYVDGKEIEVSALVTAAGGTDVAFVAAFGA